MRRTSRSILSAAAAAAALAIIAASGAPARAAVTPNVRCAVAKRKAAIQRLLAIEGCLDKAPENGTPPADPACVAAADQRFQRAFARIEAKGGCAPEGDEPVVKRSVDQCETGLERLLPGVCQPSGTPCSADVPCCNLFCVVSELGQTGVCQ
jgi:hypothetical protein